MIEHHSDNVLVSLNQDKPDLFDRNNKNLEVAGD
jgi:hypothetical protein